MTRLASLALFWQCIAPAPLLDAAETPEVPGSGDVFARAKTELHRAVQDGRIAGGAHLVVRNGKTLYSEAAGLGDLDEKTPFTADSILRIYSMSKPITSVAAMMLFEQGKYGLDDPVAQFIPAFTNATVLETVDGKTRQVPPKRPITVRDVFRHTTGYSYGDEPSVREFYQREGLRYWGPQELFPPKMTIARAAEALARVPALHHPGGKFTYGFNTDLLGRLIEIWSGEPLDRYLQRAVFEPLEMADTGFSVPREKRSRFASCYLLQEGKLAVLDPGASSPFHAGFEFLSGGGGLVSTVRDCANFCQMLVDGGQFKERRLLKPDTLRLMFEDQLRGVDGTSRFGLGFGIDDVVLGPGAGQRKAACYRWGGYASTQFAVVPDERLFQIFALQQLPYTEELAKQQFGTVYAALPPRAASTGAAPEFAHPPQVPASNTAGASPGAGGSPGYQTDTNILYLVGGDRTDYEQERCRLDVYYPTDRKDFPTVVWFHGGGLTGGNRSIPGPLKEKGIAVVAAGYRLSPRAKSPAYIEDAGAAVAWTFRNIEKYGGSTSRVFVSGHSAGGYLTSMVGLDRRWLAAHGMEANRIAGLVPLSPQAITHFTIRAERGVSDKQPIVDDMAPLFHVRNDAPPILLVTGDREKELLGRYEENAYFWRMFKVVGHPDAELIELKGYDHGQMAEPAYPLLLRFIEKHSPASTPNASGPAHWNQFRGPNGQGVLMRLISLRGLRSFTILGWLKPESLQTGSGGNRIVFCLNHDGDGIDLVCHPDGRLRLSVNQWPDGVRKHPLSGVDGGDPKNF